MGGKCRRSRRRGPVVRAAPPPTPGSSPGATSPRGGGALDRHHRLLPVRNTDDRFGDRGDFRAQPGAQRVVADRLLLQRGRADAAGRSRVHRDAPGDRLCRRRRGSLSLRGDDARHRLRVAAHRLHAQPSVRNHHRAGAAWRDDRRRLRASGGADGGGSRDPRRAGTEHRRARDLALHPLPVRVRDCRAHPAGGDDRRDRAHPSRPRGHAHAQGMEAAAPPPRRSDQAYRARYRAGDEAVIGLGAYLTVAAVVFTIGVLGIFLNRRNVILMLMAIELILLAVNINLVAFSAYLGDLTGQVLAMFVLTVAAAEAAIGLAILVIFFRRRGTIAVDAADRMRG